jgi:hypothetical protein
MEDGQIGGGKHDGRCKRFSELMNDLLLRREIAYLRALRCKLQSPSATRQS